MLAAHERQALLSVKENTVAVRIAMAHRVQQHIKSWLPGRAGLPQQGTLRSVFINEPDLTPEYCDNTVTNTKYTPYNFICKNLWEQFSSNKQVFPVNCIITAMENHYTGRSYHHMGPINHGAHGHSSSRRYVICLHATSGR